VSQVQKKIRKQYQAATAWLTRARDMRKRLDALQESKQKAYDKARSSTAPLRLGAAAKGKAVQADGKAVQYVHYSDEVDRQIARLEQVRAEILNVIAQVEDNTLAALLIEYYVNNKTWYEAAAALGYSYRHTIQQKRPAALRTVAALLKVDTK